MEDNTEFSTASVNTLKMMYPWVVREALSGEGIYGNNIETIADFNAIAEKLRVVGEVDVKMVEEHFSDPATKQSQHLVKLSKAIQDSQKGKYRGIHIITDDPVSIHALLNGLAYVWSLTLRKSSGVYQTKKISKLCHLYNTSFNSEEYQDRYNQLKYMSLLILPEFYPVTGKYTISSAPEITDLIASRVRDVKDSFTIVVSIVDTSSIIFQKYAKKKEKDALDSERIYQALSTQLSSLREIYGTYVSNIIERSFASVVLLLEVGNPQHKISYL